MLAVYCISLQFYHTKTHTHPHTHKDGKMAFFTCPYDTAYKDSPKYLKKRDHNVSITLIRSDGRMGWTTAGRYRWNDDKNSSKFIVHIFPLTLNDTGTYVCGVEAGEDRDKQEIKVDVYGG